MNSAEIDEREHLGRSALRLFCSVLLKPETRIEFCRMIESNVFTDVLQKTLFEEIATMGRVESRRLRELLPGKVALRGFPEFDLGDFLAPAEVREEEIEKLFESAFRLIELSYPEENPSGEL